LRGFAMREAMLLNLICPPIVFAVCLLARTMSDVRVHIPHWTEKVVCYIYLSELLQQQLLLHFR
jgi:hypothetical protein